MKSASEDLQKQWYEASSKIYQQTAGQQGQPGAEPEADQAYGQSGSGESEESKDEAVDADFEVVDDDKK
jgi:molecular chaperone DnaK